MHAMIHGVTLRRMRIRGRRIYHVTLIFATWKSVKRIDCAFI
jgi:hypothetical protein